jgi:hypothetical protein
MSNTYISPTSISAQVSIWRLFQNEKANRVTTDVARGEQDMRTLYLAYCAV